MGWAYDDHSKHLVGIAGRRWSVALTRGRSDAAIPTAIAEERIAVLPGSVIAWAAAIPEATWFTPTFTRAYQVTEALTEAGFGFRRTTPVGVVGLEATNDYIDELTDLDRFGVGLVPLPLHPEIGAGVSRHIMIDDDVADEIGFLIGSYPPTPLP